MGFRITTNMMMNSYRFNLQNSTKKLSDARDMVLTQRQFSSYADDPAAAAQAFRLRRDYYKTTSYLSNTKDVYSKFNTAWHNLGGVVEDLSDATARVSAIRGDNGTAGESRKALAVVLRETAESVVHSMNQQLGDHFIFAGNDALNAPFSWKGDTLLYRGVNVNAGTVKSPAAPPNWGALDADGVPENMPDSSADEREQAWINYYNDVKATNGNPTVPKPSATPAWAVKENLDSFGAPIDDKLVAANVDMSDPYNKAWADYLNDQADLKKLDQMSGEEMYIDLGMGAAESSPNNPVKGTYFNNALCGIDYLGYGVDEDGDPKSLPLLMRELADVFETWGENGQKYLPEQYRDKSYEEIQAILKEGGPEAEEINAYHAEHEAKAFRMLDKIKAAQEHTTEKWVELDANSVFLQTTESRLTTQKSDLNTQVLDIEQVDLAEAITSFSWQQYCYNSALKIGNQLLSQSLIDYMN